MAELRITGTGTIKLFESDDTSSVTIASPASLGGDRTITLPDANVDLTEVNTMPIANLDIDGGTDIGANIADSDLLIIDDGAGGTNRKTAASRLKTYVGAGAGAFDIANLDIDGGTDIGADIVDADLFIIDDGAGGTNRKVAASRIKSYASGNFVLLLDTTLSNSSSFTADNSILTSTYKKYIIDCVNLELQSQSHVGLFGSSNNGSSYVSSGYQETNFIMTSGMSNNEYYTRFNNNGSGGITLVGNAQTITNDKHIDMQIQLFNPTGGNDYKRVLFHAGYSNTSNQEITVIGTGTFGGTIGTDALNNIKIEAGTGNLKSGNIKVYGVL